MKFANPADYVAPPKRELIVVAVDGKVVSRSRNLAGVRNYARAHRAAFVDIKKEPDGRGSLRIGFQNDSLFHTYFADYTVMIDHISRWRNVYGAQLVVRDDFNKPFPNTGVVERRNPWLHKA